MSDMTFANEIMKSLLVEAKLIDSFSSFVEGSIIRFKIKGGSEEIFTVRENLAGRIKMVHNESHVLFTFTKDSLKNGVLTIAEFDKKEPNFEGEKRYLQLDEFLVSKKNGDTEEIDVVDKELEGQLSEINNEIKKTEKGDILYISSEEKNPKGDITNTILLKVVDVHENMKTFILDGVESEQDGKGDVNSYVMDKLIKAFHLQDIYIHYDNMAKIVNGGITLPIQIGKKFMGINNLISVESHPSSDSDIDDEDMEELSHKEFMEKNGNSKAFNQAIAKTPNFWETLIGASPKGRAQLNKLIQKSEVNNTYLTVGNNITFKLTSRNVIIDNKHGLKNNKLMVGRMEKNNSLVIGRRRQGHWELKLVKEFEDEPSKYNVKIRFCNKDLTCVSKGNGVIKIVRNG